MDRTRNFLRAAIDCCFCCCLGADQQELVDNQEANGESRPPTANLDDSRLSIMESKIDRALSNINSVNIRLQEVENTTVPQVDDNSLWIEVITDVVGQRDRIAHEHERRKKVIYPPSYQDQVESI